MKIRLFFAAVAFLSAAALASSPDGAHSSMEGRGLHAQSLLSDPGQSAFESEVNRVNCELAYPLTLWTTVRDLDQMANSLPPEAKENFLKNAGEERARGVIATRLIEKLYKEGVIKPSMRVSINMGQGLMNDPEAIHGPNIVAGDVDINLDRPLTEKALRDFFAKYPSPEERIARYRRATEKANAFTEKTGIAIPFGIQDLPTIESGLDNLLGALGKVAVDKLPISSISLETFTSGPRSPSAEALINSTASEDEMVEQLNKMLGMGDKSLMKIASRFRKGNKAILQLAHKNHLDNVSFTALRMLNPSQRTLLEIQAGVPDMQDDALKLIASRGLESFAKPKPVDPFLAQEKTAKCAVQLGLGVAGGVAYDNVPNKRSVLDTYAVLTNLAKQGYRLKPPTRYLLISYPQEKLGYYDTAKATLVIPVGSTAQDLAPKFFDKAR